MTAATALAHDILAARAGGERVLGALAAMFPDAPIHTLIHDPNATFSSLNEVADPSRVRTSWLDRVAPLRSRYRAVLPVAALTWAATKVDADVTICSTSGLSHHVRTTGAKIVYCHTPARWIHDPHVYMQGYGRGVRAVAALIRPPLRWLDGRAMRSADLVLANSMRIAEEIERIYSITATVVAPSSPFSLDGPVRAIPQAPEAFVLLPMRPLAYKRFDVLVEAARRRPDLSFLHIGDGPHRAALLADAPPNLISVGAVDDAELRWAYRHARVAAMTAAEDFGLVPLEAAAHGLVTVAPDARGIRDHDPATVVLYPFGDVDGFLDAIDAAPAPTRQIDAGRLGVARFEREIRNALARALDRPEATGFEQPPTVANHSSGTEAEDDG